MPLEYIEALDTANEVDRDIVESSFRKAKLTEKQAKICRMILYKGYTQEEIAYKLHIKQQAVSKTFLVALSKIKNFKKHENRL